MLLENSTRQIIPLLTTTTPTAFIYSERLEGQLLTLILSISISRQAHATSIGYKFSTVLGLNTVLLPRDFVVLPCLIQVAFEITWTNYKIRKIFISNFKFEFNRYRRGLETCPQAKTSKSGHAIFFSFFRRVRATSMTQRRVKNTRVHFWKFSPVSVKFQNFKLAIFHELFSFDFFKRLVNRPNSIAPL